MGYYITKTGLSGKTVYWTGGVHWSDDSSKKKIKQIDHKKVLDLIMNK